MYINLNHTDFLFGYCFSFYFICPGKVTAVAFKRTKDEKLSQKLIALFKTETNQEYILFIEQHLNDRKF